LGRSLFRKNRLDPCEADLAAILQPKGACIDHRGDAPLALRLKRASGGDHRTGGGDNKREAAQQDRRATSTTKFNHDRRPEHDAMFSWPPHSA
jgi:hypothetical protein